MKKFDYQILITGETLVPEQFSKTDIQGMIAGAVSINVALLQSNPKIAVTVKERTSLVTATALPPKVQ